MPPICLRAPRLDEVDRIRHIEDDAGLRFAEVGLRGDFRGLPSCEIEDAIHNDLALVAVDGHDAPVAFALCLQFDDVLHLHELNVLRSMQGGGLGSGLLNGVMELARRRECRWVSLTTYRDVSFNGPFYAKRGFREWPAEQLPGWLVAIRSREVEEGLDELPRVVMRKRVA